MAKFNHTLITSTAKRQAKNKKQNSIYSISIILVSFQQVMIFLMKIKIFYILLYNTIDLIAQNIVMNVNDLWLLMMDKGHGKNV